MYNCGHVHVAFGYVLCGCQTNAVSLCECRRV